MRATKARFTVVWLGGPKDGAVEKFEGDAPPFLTWRNSTTAATGEGAIHRYRRGTCVGGPERAPIWVYEHEGSVLT